MEYFLTNLIDLEEYCLWAKRAWSDFLFYFQTKALLVVYFKPKPQQKEKRKNIFANKLGLNWAKFSSSCTKLMNKKYY